MDNPEVKATTPTSRKVWSSDAIVVRSSSVKKGFTLIEISVVIVLLALLAALIMPNLVAVKASRERNAFRSELRRLAVSAREDAILRSSIRVLRYEDGSNAFLTSTVSEDGTPADSGRSVALPEGVRVDSFRVGAREVAGGEWEMRFQIDGSTEGGGVELSDGAFVYSLRFAEDGTVRLLEEELPNLSDERWSAGSYEQRT
jgi:prepilin-type N-terminal cleavage/methylation domain-containing protein